MKDLNIRKTAVLLGVQIFGVLVLGELIASAGLFAYLGAVGGQSVVANIWGVLGIIMLAKVFLQGYLVILLTYNWTSNRYIIRGHHLVMRHQLLAQDEKLYELSNLQNIHVHQSWLGRLANFGTLELSFAMPGHVFSMFLSDVHNPRYYAVLFEEHFAPPGSQHQAHPASMLNPPFEDGRGNDDSQFHAKGAY